MIKEYRCPKCERVSAGEGVIPKCKGTKKKRHSEIGMIEIKKEKIK